MWKSTKNFNYGDAKVGDAFLFAELCGQEGDTGKPISFTILQVKVEEVAENPWTHKTYPTLFRNQSGDTISAEDISRIEAYCTPEDFYQDISNRKGDSSSIPDATPETVPIPFVKNGVIKIDVVGNTSDLEASSTSSENIITERPKTRTKVVENES